MTTAATRHTAKDMRLFRIAVQNAKVSVGKAVFDFQPLAIQRALISSEIITLLNAQDEDVPDARVRSALQALDAITGTWHPQVDWA